MRSRAELRFTRPLTRTANNQGEYMKISGLILRFLVVYPIALFVSAVAVTFLGFNLFGLMNVGILSASVYFLVYRFGKENSHFLTKNEITQVCLFFLLIDFFFKFVFSVVFQGMLRDVGFSSILITLGVIMPIHAVVIFYSIKFAGNQLAKKGVVDT
ncbi:MAG: ABZJ_00895 family protein [Amphritea sp.]